MSDDILEKIAEDVANFACREKRAEPLQDLGNWLTKTPTGLALASALAGGTIAGVTSKRNKLRKALQGALAGGALGGAAGLAMNMLGNNQAKPNLSRASAEAWRNASDVQRTAAMVGVPSLASPDGTATQAIKNAPGIASVQSHPLIAAGAGVGTPLAIGATLSRLRGDKDLAAAVSAHVSKPFEPKVEKGGLQTPFFGLNSPGRNFPRNNPSPNDLLKGSLSPDEYRRYVFANNGYAQAYEGKGGIIDKLFPETARNARISDAYRHAISRGLARDSPAFAAGVANELSGLKTPASKAWTAGRLGKYMGLGTAAAVLAPTLVDQFWRSSTHPANVEYNRIMQQLLNEGAK